MGTNPLKAELQVAGRLGRAGLRGLARVSSNKRLLGALSSGKH